MIGSKIPFDVSSSPPTISLFDFKYILHLSISYKKYYFFANASKTICFGSKSLQTYTLENGGFKLGFWSA